MRKINVVTQKELVDSSLLGTCTAVVVDVYLATSTITYLLENNWSPVYAVKNTETALEIENRKKTPILLMGERNGKQIERFQYPDPTLICKADSEAKPAVICSTNGTVAIERSKMAKTLYASSLLNGHRVAEQIVLHDDGSSVVLICSGNAGRFSMEDFIGSGHIVNHLIKMGEFKLSDSAAVALEAYNNAKERNFEPLLDCETSHLLRRTGYSHTIKWVIENFETSNIVPIYKNGKFVPVTKIKVKKGWS